jgi:murein DD-endopeptidase MepM/ murein hydrolase activator NlpD
VRACEFHSEEWSAQTTGAGPRRTNPVLCTRPGVVHSSQSLSRRPQAGSVTLPVVAAAVDARAVAIFSSRVLAVLAVVLVLVSPVGARAEVGPDPVGTWPLRPGPEVVASFDPPDGPYGAGHRGVDLAGSPGQTVHAALAGTVSFAGAIAGRGVVVVAHGPTRTTYEPVTASVDVGDPVGGGSPIGTLQLPGSHCFPRACLHWGWIEGADTYLDPLRLVGVGPMRLLPLWREAPVGSGPASPPPPPAAVQAVLRLLFGLG